MKRKLIGSSSEPSQTRMEAQLLDAVTEAITESNDKVIEIRPAKKSRGGRMRRMLFLVGGALAAAYWMRKSQRPSETIQSAAHKTADRTKRVTEQASETIQESGETVADRLEETSQKAGEQVQKTGESAADKTEKAGEKAGEKADNVSSGSSSSSSGSGSESSSRSGSGSSSSSGSDSSSGSRSSDD